MKLTKKIIESRFKHLCDALGYRIAKNYKDVGAWKLDYQRCYGGYVIQELRENGSISHPFGHSRMKASEFYESINFALRCVQLDRLDHTESAQYWPSDKIKNGE